MSRRALILTLSTIAALAPAASADAASRYASPSSTDVVGGCASLAPCRLDHAVGDASPGDEVIVEPGSYDVTYAVSATVPLDVHGIVAQPRPRLVGGISANGAVVSMTGGGSLEHVYLETGVALGSVLDIEGVVARDLEIYTPATVGASIRGASGGTVLGDSVVRATGADPAIEAKDGTTAGPVKLLNDTIYAPDGGAIAIKGKQGDATTRVRNSIVRGGAQDVKVYSKSYLTADHSNLRPVAAAGYGDGGSNQSADPAFANPATGDLRPLDGSPVIDAGDAGDPDLGPRDLAGDLRIVGAAPDIGAYEFVPPGVDARAPDNSGSDGSRGTDDPAGDNTTPLPPASKPVHGKKVNVEPVSGDVKVRRPGGHGFVNLADAASIPTGSTVDATRGVVALTSTRDASGAPQTGSFWGGRFKVAQSTKGDGYTELVLAGGSFRSCRSGTHGKVSAKRSRGIRQLWGHDRHGHFRTRGRNGQATVRGTSWLTQDRCDGTLFKVKQGAIDVKRKGAHKAVRVTAGNQYLARARRR